MKQKTKACSTGHGTGVIQQTPLHRSALLKPLPQIRIHPPRYGRLSSGYSEERSRQSAKQASKLKTALDARARELVVEQQEAARKSAGMRGLVAKSWQGAKRLLNFSRKSG